MHVYCCSQPFGSTLHLNVLHAAPGPSYIYCEIYLYFQRVLGGVFFSMCALHFIFYFWCTMKNSSISRFIETQGPMLLWSSMDEKEYIVHISLPNFVHHSYLRNQHYLTFRAGIRYGLSKYMYNVLLLCWIRRIIRY